MQAEIHKSYKHLLYAYTYVRAYVRMCTHTQCINIHSSQTSVEYNRTWRELYTDHHMHTAPMYAYKLTAAYNTAEHIPYTRIEKLVQCTFSLCEKTLMASDTESAQTMHNAMRTIPQGHMHYTTFATQNDSVWCTEVREQLNKELSQRDLEWQQMCVHF